MKTTYPYEPDHAVAPGETLLETIEALDLTQKELAQRMGRPLKTINQIIKGTAQIMPETSLQLEKVTGVHASFWNTAETNYREALARREEQRRRDSQTAWVRRFSYTKLVSLRLVPSLSGKAERVEALLHFFGVASPLQWEVTYGELCGAARESSAYQTDLGDLSAWLRAGELVARECQCAPYDRERFLETLRTVRSLTMKSPAEVWPEVTRLCAASGVALALVPELPNTHVFGFTRWLSPQKALIQLSLRYKTDDLLWFTFFHEAAHIFLHGKRDVFIERRGVDSPKESEANQWAGDFLIPPDEWQTFLATLPAKPSATAIKDFASRIGIAPSIPLGRLQHREKRVSPGLFNSLKHKVDIDWIGI
ncbi:ImmA/IrrE family metallo-endopeptidase [soil metagenome]